MLLSIAALTGTALVLSWLGCDRAPAVRFEDRELTVGCGACIFAMPGVMPCPWAAEIDGKHYLMKGRLDHNHNGHAADGICNMPRQARITGELRDDLLYVEKMTLLEAANVPATPRFTPADIH